MKTSLIAVLILGALGFSWYLLANDTGTAANMGQGEDKTQAETSVSSAEKVQNSEENTASPQTFTVHGSNYKFDVTEIRVREGDTVTINFEASEGFHDWVVDEFSAATPQVKPGQPTTVTFVADKTGVFTYYCSVGQHRANGMVGTLIVE